jgi:hypothetical protein
MNDFQPFITGVIIGLLISLVILASAIYAEFKSKKN